MKKDALLLIGAGVACGLLWWAVSLLLGAGAYGVVGSHAATGAVAGACTGVVVAAISAVVYRRAPVGALLWYSPVSVYLAIGIHGAAIFAIRSALGDFAPDQIPSAVGLQSVIGMWWGVTMLPPVAVLVHLLAYANHRVLRRLVVGG